VIEARWLGSVPYHEAEVLQRGLHEHAERD
jgi:hypothetical protein